MRRFWVSSQNMSAIKSTLLHAFEVILCLGIGLAILRLFHVGTGQEGVIIGIVVNAFVKWARASDVIPVSDYVNK
jgi:hypothetical protein